MMQISLTFIAAMIAGAGLGALFMLYQDPVLQLYLTDLVNC